MTHRAYEAAAREAKDEPFTFTYGSNPYVFTVNIPVAMGHLILFMRTKDMKYSDAVLAYDELLRSWMRPEDHEEWDAALMTFTDLDVLSKIVDDIVEETTGRPTPASST